MRNGFFLIGVIGLSRLAWAVDGEVSIPWEEFKSVYRQTIERELMDQNPALPIEYVYSIDEARYAFRIETEKVSGEVTFTGRVLSGNPKPIPLFGEDAIVSGVLAQSGGALLTQREEGQIAFLPEVGAPSFQVTLSVLLQPGAQDMAHEVAWNIPRALQNQLTLTLPPGFKLLSSPGVASADDTWNFSARDSLEFTYLDAQTADARTVTEVDVLSRIEFRQNRVAMTSVFAPLRIPAGSITIQAPPDAHWLASTLPSSAIRAIDNGRFEVDLTHGIDKPFSLEFALPAIVETEAMSVTLPTIEENQGQEGRFVIDEPDDGQISVTADGLIKDLPVSRLDPVLLPFMEGYQSCMSVPEHQPIALNFKKFQSIASPATVLDSLYVFVSFEDGGNVLSVLTTDFPGSVGPRVQLLAVPDSEIWSLSVNGSQKSVYEGADSTWIVPLDGADSSHVELAYLQRGTKLGLQGRLDVTIPETGMPCREIRVCIGLPKRVEMLSVEGPLSPAGGEDWTFPAEFRGTPHFFSRAFYMGEAMRLSIAYKEPVRLN